METREPQARSTFRSSPVRCFLITIVAAGLLVAPDVMTTAANAYPSALMPSSGAFFGAFSKQRGNESRTDAITRLESQIGRKLKIDHDYTKWDSPIPMAPQQEDKAAGRIPFINWNARRRNGTVVRWSAIANGSQDQWIRARAQAFRTFAYPVYLTFHHEPENDLATFGSTADYVGAFRRVVSVFRQENVSNVGFVWTMMADTFNPGPPVDPMSLYPGDSYVDFIGADGYNWYPGRRSAAWRSFADIFVNVRAFANAHGKPWMAVETGVQEKPGDTGAKAQWFRDALTTAASWPDLKAFMYFNSDTIYPWWVDSTSTSMSTFRSIVHAAWFNGGSGGTVSTPNPSPTPAPPSPSPPPPPPKEAVSWRTTSTSGQVDRASRLQVAALEALRSARSRPRTVRRCSTTVRMLVGDRSPPSTRYPREAIPTTHGTAPSRIGMAGCTSGWVRPQPGNSAWFGASPEHRCGVPSISSPTERSGRWTMPTARSLLLAITSTLVIGYGSNGESITWQVASRYDCSIAATPRPRPRQPCLPPAGRSDLRLRRSSSAVPARNRRRSPSGPTTRRSRVTGSSDTPESPSVTLVEGPGGSLPGPSTCPDHYARRRHPTYTNSEIHLISRHLSVSWVIRAFVRSLIGSCSRGSGRRPIHSLRSGDRAKFGTRVWRKGSGRITRSMGTTRSPHPGPRTRGKQDAFWGSGPVVGVHDQQTANVREDHRPHRRARTDVEPGASGEGGRTLDFPSCAPVALFGHLPWNVGETAWHRDAAASDRAGRRRDRTHVRDRSPVQPVERPDPHVV